MIHRYEKPVKGKLSDCVSELNKYLSVYQCDAEGWFELAEIYLSEYEYEKAAYCFEELIILNPANYIIYQVNNIDIMPHYYYKIRRCMILSEARNHTTIEFCSNSVHYMELRYPKRCRSILNEATRCQPNIATKFFFRQTFIL